MMQIAVAPDVLMFNDGAEHLREPVEKEFEVLLYEALRHADAERHADATPADGARAALLAPRMVRFLLWPRTASRARAQQVAARAFAAERTLLGVGDADAFTGWTADCRAQIHRGGDVEYQPALRGTSIPIDLRSPHARCIDLLGGSQLVRPPRRLPDEGSAAAATARIQQAWDGIRATRGSVADCVAAWTRTVVVQFDADQQFWSGSNGQYIGRVMIVNPTLETTPIEEIADALVHEGIHGFLSMHERLEPWVRDNGLYTDEAAVESPWSGSPLPVRPFLQACFVWYGLTMFWAEHVEGTVFDAAIAREMLLRAVRGFCGGSFADKVWPWREQLHGEIVEVVTDMQRTVRALVE